MFLTELCDLISVPRPEPARDDGRTDYRFEYPVAFHHPDGVTSTGRIDLYKRDCFVLEAKQSTNAKLAEQLPLFGAPNEAGPNKSGAVRGTNRWAMAMQRARAQAESYAKALPVAHGWPPFLVVVDVGHEVQLFADFSRTGRNYNQFPDAQRFRIRLVSGCGTLLGSGPLGGRGLHLALRGPRAEAAPEEGDGLMLAIHPNARTNPAVRAEIARSSEPTGELARRHGLSTETVRKWRKRFLFVAINRRSRSVHLAVRGDETEASARAFLAEALSASAIL